MQTLYNCLCPRCGSISTAYLEDDDQASGLKCPECGGSGLSALPKNIFGT